MLVFLLTIVFSLRTKQSHPAVMPWEDWKQAFKPQGYYSDVEHDSRLLQYQKNVAFIIRHNSLGKSYTVGVNQFADLSLEEWRQMVLRPMNITGHKREVKKLEVSKPMQESYDWRDHNAVTPVKNQGSCGSCWAFSTIGAVEGCVAIASGKLVSLSEQELVSCDKECHGCGGGLMDFGFEWIASNGGISSEDVWPYTAKNGVCSEDGEQYKVSVTKGHQDVEKDSDDQLIAALQQGPVSVAIEADQQAFQLYKSGIFNETCGTNLDHGVLAVGYSPDYYIVKNSWGAHWGEEGYIRMARNMPQEGGQCGILMSASYPTECSYLNPGPAPHPVTTPKPDGEPFQNPNGPKGCMTGEASFTVENDKTTGSFCTQWCDTTSNTCPIVPSHIKSIFTAGGCALFGHGDGKLYCGVFCDTSDPSACDPANGMTCKPYNFAAGLCTYGA